MKIPGTRTNLHVEMGHTKNRFLPLFYRMKFLALLILVLPLCVNAQQLVQVSGKITEKESGNPVPFVNIVNMRNRMGVSADGNGFYTILCGASDTLLISVINHKKIKFSLPEGVIGSYRADFSLEKDIILLKDATVNEYGDVKSEINNMELKSEEKRIVADPSLKHANAPENFGVRFSPLSWIKTRDQREAQELNKLRSGQHTMSGNTRITKELLDQTVPELKEEQVMDFLNYLNQCELANLDIGQISEYDLKLGIRRCYLRYAEEKQLPR